MSRYDEPLKRLGRLCPKDFIHWLCPDVQLFGKVYFEDREFEIVRRNADLLYRIKTVKDEQFYLHVEFQGTFDDEFVLRLFEYSTLIHKNTKCPVETIVIFIDSTSAIESLPTVYQNKLGLRIFSEFRFTKLILPKKPWREILKKGFPALLPLIPFCEIKSEEALEALQETEKALENLEDKRLKLELETVFAVFGGYLFPHLIRQVFGEKRMKDLMESIIYQDMVKQATTDATIKRSQKSILVVLGARFGQILEEIRHKVEQIQSIETLDVLTKSAATVHCLEEFEKLL